MQPNENRQSKKGMSNSKGSQKGTVREDTVGSSNGGIKFGIPNHPDKSVVRSPEKG